MRVRNHHHVPRRVRIRIQNNETTLAAIDNPRLGIVSILDRVAENAPRSFPRGRNIGVAPRSPEVIHSGRLADANNSGELPRPRRFGKMLLWGTVPPRRPV